MDDEFDDDDLFDNLPVSTLQALENGTHSTVVHTANVLPVSKPFQRPSVPQNASRQLNTTARGHVAPLSRPVSHNSYNRGGAHVEEVIDLDNYPQEPRNGYNAPPQSNRWTASQHAPLNNGRAAQMPHRPSSRPSSQNGGIMSQTRSQGAGNLPNTAALQAKIQRLEREKLDLKQEADAAQSRAQTKTGEATILRTKLEATTRDFELKIQELQQAHSEAAALQKAETRAAERAKEQVETDRKFLQHDMVLEASRSRAVAKKLPAVARSRTLPEELRKTVVSPRKPKQPFGDGFDDDVVVTHSPTKPRTEPSTSFRVDDDDAGAAVSFPVSPAKSRGSKPTTPSHRPEKKRKRGNQTPTSSRALSFENQAPESSPLQLFTPDIELEVVDDALPQISRHAPTSADFSQTVLNYKLTKSGRRFFEVLGEHTLPLSPAVTLSNMLLDKWSASQLTADEGPDFCFCTTVCGLWMDCINEQYFAPVDVFSDVLHFVIRQRRFAFTRRLVNYVLPPAKESSRLVAQRVAEAELSKTKKARPLLDIDTEAILDLLLSIAQACENSDEDKAIFWSSIPLYWTLIVLYPELPLPDISLVCGLLSTSVLDSSFGPIFSNEFDLADNQEQAEQHIVGRLTNLLLHDYSARYSDHVFPLHTILSFRLSILHALQAFCAPPRIGISIATHSSAIGELYAFLHDTIELLYDTATSPADVHATATQCINAAMRIIFVVTSAHSDRFSVSSALERIPGGTHLPLIALTRLAFCDPYVLELGIDRAASDAAHALLDGYVNIEEGAEILKMFPSVDSTALGGLGEGDEAETAEAEGEQEQQQQQQQQVDVEAAPDGRPGDVEVMDLT